MLSPPNISGGAGGLIMNVPDGGGDGGDTGAGPTGTGDIGPDQHYFIDVIAN